MLGNGMGKGRASQHGFAKKQATWRLIFLSNGEIGLSQLLNEAGKKVKAGQEVRFIEIPADTEEHGLFETLHGFEGGADFSKYLKEACSQYYGTSARAFLASLVENIEKLPEFVKKVIQNLELKHLPKSSSSQVIRVFGHLSLIAAAGELASYYGITGWGSEIASEGVMKCFSDWLKARGGTGMHEEQAAIDQVVSIFQQHGESRFSPWQREQDDKSRTINRMGYRKESENGLEFLFLLRLSVTRYVKGLTTNMWLSCA